MGTHELESITTMQVPDNLDDSCDKRDLTLAELREQRISFVIGMPSDSTMTRRDKEVEEAIWVEHGLLRTEWQRERAARTENLIVSFKGMMPSE